MIFRTKKAFAKGLLIVYLLGYGLMGFVHAEEESQETDTVSKRLPPPPKTVRA